MNYTVTKRYIIANDGYLFRHKIDGITAKSIRNRNGILDYYDVIEEPIPEPEEEIENDFSQADT